MHELTYLELKEIDIKKQGTSTYAFIQYSDISSVVKAMRKLDGENLGANRIKLGFGKSMPTNCVWIHGISENFPEKSLSCKCARFGNVANLTIDRERGNALVFYDSLECASLAVSDLKGRVLGGRRLQIDFASRECQTAFFEKLDPPHTHNSHTLALDPNKPWERRGSTSTSSYIAPIETEDVANRVARDTYETHSLRTNSTNSHNNNNSGRYEGPNRASRTPYRGQSPPLTPRTASATRGRSFRVGGSESFTSERRNRYDGDEYSQDFDDFNDTEGNGRDASAAYKERRDFGEPVRGRSFSPVRNSEGSDSPSRERVREERSTSPFGFNSRDKLNSADDPAKER